MSRIPMHNRFVEGFIESDSPGDTIDALSSRIVPGRPGIDSGILERSARAARAAAIRAALSAFGAALRRLVLDPPRARFDAWRERRNAMKELCGLDDRSLAELGLHRAEIPFVVARPLALRDQRAGRRAAHDNDNRLRADRDPVIIPLCYVK